MDHVNYATQFLAGLGYSVSTKAQEIIGECRDWYRNAETTAHTRITVNGEPYNLLHMGFGKRVCSDDASLCEVVEINAGGENQTQFDAVNELLKDNRFPSMYRRQLETCAALGTAACYVRLEGADVLVDGNGQTTLSGGRVRLNYVDANGFFPLTVENDVVQEAAFCGVSMVKGKQQTVLVICTKQDDRYQYRTVVFDENGMKKTDDTVLLGDVKPFAVMRTADVNNIPDMHGYGLPKLKNAIPVLLALDGAWTVLTGDIDTAEKIVLINELLCGFTEDGTPIKPNQQLKRRFVMLGQEKLPDKNSLVEEIVPEIRVEPLRNTIELLLSVLSMQFGYGLKKYRFDGGQITTATQYAGERQDQLQELNKQRTEAKVYITDIIRAALWFCNTYQEQSWNIDAEVKVEFDDSYITDKESRLLEMRNDIVAGIGGTHVLALYLQEKYNLSDEEAAAWAGQMPSAKDEGE